MKRILGLLIIFFLVGCASVKFPPCPSPNEGLTVSSWSMENVPWPDREIEEMTKTDLLVRRMSWLGKGWFYEFSPRRQFGTGELAITITIRTKADEERIITISSMRNVEEINDLAKKMGCPFRVIVGKPALAGEIARGVKVTLLGQ